MKHLVLAMASILTLWGNHSQADSLRHQKLKSELCSKVVDSFTFTSSRRKFIEKDCVKKGNFEISEYLRDERLNDITGMKIAVGYAYQDELKLKAQALILRNFAPNTLGQLEKGPWFIKSFTVQEEEETLQTKTLLEEMAGLAEVHNGYTEVLPYKKDGFNWKKFIKELEQALPNEDETDEEYSSSCVYETWTDKKSNISSLLEIEGSGSDFSELLQKLEDNKAIYKLIMRGYVDGETENCSYQYFHLFTEDGWHLNLSYDFTT